MRAYLFNHVIVSWKHEFTFSFIEIALCIKCFNVIEISLNIDWKLDELADVLYLYKTIQLDPNYHNNYKELARRMTDAGWQQDNDQCCHQIECMKKHYDAMIDSSKRTGSAPFFEPLTKELNECFGALKDVNPDQVYSSRRGTKLGNPVDEDDRNVNNNAASAEPSTSSGTSEKEKKIVIVTYFIK